MLRAERAEIFGLYPPLVTFVKSGCPILNKCFQGHGGRRFVGAQLIRPPGPIAGYYGPGPAYIYYVLQHS